MRTDLFDFELPPERIALRPARSPRRGAAAGGAARPGAGIRRPRGARSPGAAAPRRRARGQRHQGDPGATARPAHRARQPSRAIEATLHRAPRRRALARLREAREAAGAGRRGALRRRRQGLLPRPARRHGRGQGRGRRGDARLRVPWPVLDQAVEERGDMPLPPYIAARRAPDERDRVDYQTLFARRKARSPRRPRDCISPTPCVAGLARTRDRAPQGDAACRRRHVPSGEGGGYRRAPHACRRRAASAPRPPPRSTRCAARGGRIVAVGSTALRLLESATRRGRRRSGRSRARRRCSSRRAIASAPST